MLEVAAKVTGDSYTAIEYTKGGPNEELQNTVRNASLTFNVDNQTQLQQAIQVYIANALDDFFDSIMPVGFVIALANTDTPPRQGIGGVNWEKLPDDLFMGSDGTYFGAPGTRSGTVNTTDGHFLTEQEAGVGTTPIGPPPGGNDFLQLVAVVPHSHNLTTLNRYSARYWKRMS